MRAHTHTHTDIACKGRVEREGGTTKTSPGSHFLALGSGDKNAKTSSNASSGESPSQTDMFCRNNQRNTWRDASMHQPHADRRHERGMLASSTRTCRLSTAHVTFLLSHMPRTAFFFLLPGDRLSSGGWRSVQGTKAAHLDLSCFYTHPTYPPKKNTLGKFGFLL